MQTASYVAMSRQTVLQQSMEVIANNLANASTTGFKSQQAVFEDYLQPGPGRQRIAYVRDIGTTRDTRQGDLHLTGNTFDMAIEGAGYYSVSTAAGPRYTRNGSFQVTPDGQLITAKGDTVLDDRGNPITLPSPSGKVVVAEDGTIADDGNPVAKLGVVDFDNPQQLVEEGTGLYTTDATSTPDTVSKIRQGTIEQSNVQSVVQMTRMVGVEGAYAEVVQILSSEDTRLKNAIDKLSRVA
jgi:flagellar basal-body rod protein FlgF